MYLTIADKGHGVRPFPMLALQNLAVATELIVKQQQAMPGLS
jgi:hypothetical protein